MCRTSFAPSSLPIPTACALRNKHHAHIPLALSSPEIPPSAPQSSTSAPPHPTSSESPKTPPSHTDTRKPIILIHRERPILPRVYIHRQRIRILLARVLDPPVPSAISTPPAHTPESHQSSAAALPAIPPSTAVPSNKSYHVPSGKYTDRSRLVLRHRTHQ